ncbi:hypothetical protein [Amycolatopsis sp. cmx-11-32]|uniref:hypothetical protein n=1 Tax=Amycolatopsis sp. cmx-11-32 TaxID=2785796 RepID=UPI0039E6C8BF
MAASRTSTSISSGSSALRRAEGESALLAGDELRGAPPGVRDRVAARAVAEAARIRRSRDDRVVLDTSGQEPAETVAALLAAMGQ